MQFLTPKLNLLSQNTDNSHLKLLFPSMQVETQEHVIYRRNGKTIDKIVEFDKNTGTKVKTTHYDYFNDKKIRSVDEYDIKTGKKIRTINYVLYKSIDEYDLETGKKLRTINYNLKDDTKISSIQEYDVCTEKIITISIYKRDGKTVSIVKNIDPVTGKVTNWVNSKLTAQQDRPATLKPTRSYDNIKGIQTKDKEHIAQLIDNLYTNNLKFEHIKP